MVQTDEDGDDSTSGGKRAYSAPAPEKGIQILALFATEPRGLTISEVFRIIIVMERLGWLAKDPVNDRYAVTYRVLDVAFRATPAQTLSNVAAPVMYELSSKTNQSCHLVVETGGHATVIHRQENMGPVGFSIRLGTVVDLVTSCSGHVLLAFATEDRRVRLVGSTSARKHGRGLSGGSMRYGCRVTRCSPARARRGNRYQLPGLRVRRPCLCGADDSLPRHHRRIAKDRA